MSTLNFIKMHGLGNDFVIVDDRDGTLTLSREVVRALSDRNSGVGCDQFIVLEKAPDSDADVFMRIYNPDGSQSGACGNATRCVASLVMAETGQNDALIQTQAGLLDCERLGQGLYSVDMGPARADWRDIPLANAQNTNEIGLTVDGFRHGAVVAVNVGNPHVVFEVANVDDIDLATFGPKIETNPLFPERTNVEVVQILSPDRIRMRVWERGAGITRACGSGACAALVATARMGLTGRTAEVVLDGGSLTIDWLADGNVLMTGPVATSFQGTLDLADYEPKS